MNWKALITSLNPGLTQNQIARKYDVDQGGLGRVFRGVYQPGIASLKAWAAIEGMPTWQFIKMAEELSQEDSPA
jgi:transcriptional regulator with XRE-family HTH domain